MVGTSCVFCSYVGRLGNASLVFFPEHPSCPSLSHSQKWLIVFQLLKIRTRPTLPFLLFLSFSSATVYWGEAVILEGKSNLLYMQVLYEHSVWEGLNSDEYPNWYQPTECIISVNKVNCFTQEVINWKIRDHALEAHAFAIYRQTHRYPLCKGQRQTKATQMQKKCILRPLEN